MIALWTLLEADERVFCLLIFDVNGGCGPLPVTVGNEGL